jgi:hypothetical protein
MKENVKKKLLPAPSSGGGGGCGDLHSAPHLILRGGVSVLAVFGPTAHSSGEANPPLMSQLDGFMMTVVLDANSVPKLRKRSVG